MLGLSLSSQSQIWYLSWSLSGLVLLKGDQSQSTVCGLLVWINLDIMQIYVTINGFMLSRQPLQCLATMVVNYNHVCGVIQSVSWFTPHCTMNII